MKKILLIDTNTTPFNEAFPVYPTGLDYLYGALKEEGIGEACVLDLTRMGGPLSSHDLKERKKRSLELIRKVVTEKQWDIIGLSLRNIDSTYPMGDGDPCLHYYLPDLIDYINCVIRFSNKGSFIVLGGTAFSMMPEIFMENRPDTCFGILGPGEASFVHLIRCIHRGDPVSRVTGPNIQRIGRLQNRVLIRKYFDLPVGDSTFGIRTKIGCGQFCAYCPYPLISGPGQHLKETGAVIEEIRLLKGIHRESGFLQPLRIMFVDDIFNRPLDHAKTILRAMIKENEIPDSWHAYLDPKSIDEEFIELVLETNGWCRSIDGPDGLGNKKRYFNFLFDIESGSSRMLKKIGKPFDVGDIVQSVNSFKRVARRHRGRSDIASMQFGFHILIGYPGEDEESVRETCTLINELDPIQIQVQVGVRIYPGTLLAKETRGILWKEKEDLIKPVFADINMTEILDRLRRYLHNRYTLMEKKGNMILINNVKGVRYTVFR